MSLLVFLYGMCDHSQAVTLFWRARWVMTVTYGEVKEICFHCWAAEVQPVRLGMQQNRAELTPAWPFSFFFFFLFWRGATLHCLWRRFKRERWGESLSYPVCVRTDPERLMFIHPHMTKTEKRRDRAEEREERQSKGSETCLFFSTYVKAGFVGHVWRSGGFLLLCV